jgi:3-hydroxyacyl-[acyl-carrier-protein] dehydratase
VSKAALTIDQIRELLPHRHPILMVDRVLEVGEKEIIATKLVGANEPYLQGHFPDHPIMPGVLVLEALAQAGGIWCLLQHPEMAHMTPALTGVDKARFRRPIRPGDVVQLEVRVVQMRKPAIRLEGRATVDGELAAEATLMAAFIDWSARS